MTQLHGRKSRASIADAPHRTVHASVAVHPAILDRAVQEHKAASVQEGSSNCPSGNAAYGGRRCDRSQKCNPEAKSGARRGPRNPKPNHPGRSELFGKEPRAWGSGREARTVKPPGDDPAGVGALESGVAPRRDALLGLIPRSPGRIPGIDSRCAVGRRGATGRDQAGASAPSSACRLRRMSMRLRA